MPSENNPQLRCLMNLEALDGLAQKRVNPLEAIRDAGYDGVQFSEPLARALKDEALRMGLIVCGSGRVNTPADVEPTAKEARDAGLSCLTLHVGWGIESEREAAALIAAILNAAAKYSIPLYPETHRATIFQDPWRTVRFIETFPGLEFNGDFSHWYTGTEMVYGGFEKKLEFIRPVLERVAFLHGRIGNPGCMQVDIGDGNTDQHPYVAHFRALWIESFRGFLLRRPATDSICFTPELLSPTYYYARVFDGREESDRWEQSLLLVSIARECFHEAQQSLPTAATRFGHCNLV
jgi:sugar phosphate isomerase/epimerase